MTGVSHELREARKLVLRYLDGNETLSKIFTELLTQISELQEEVRQLREALHE